MWILTYTTEEPKYQDGDFFQEAWFSGPPNVSYLASYLKHFNLTDKVEPWGIRDEAQKLFDGETVTLKWSRNYRFWEKQYVGAIPMY